MIIAVGGVPMYRACMGIRSFLEASRAQLTATERRLADVIAADPARAACASVAALAKDAGAHGASVVRLAKKLGFDGFPEFRAALHDEVFTAEEPAERLRERLAQLPDGGLVAELAKQEAAALAALPEHISDGDLEEAARRIVRAGRVMTCGEGGGEFLADLLADRLQRLGRAAGSVSPIPRAAALALSGATKGDTLVAMALTRMPPVLARMMAEARKDGLSVILIADPGVEFGAPPADVTLLPRRGPMSAAQTLVIPVAVVSALVLAVSRELGAGSIAAADRYGTIRRALSEPGA